MGSAPGRDVVLGRQRAGQERYSYVCEGNSQDLDYLVINPGREVALVPGRVDVIHVNAEFADYVSDHEPQLARFRLPAT